MFRLFSGIQPSGKIHLGNYLGALKNWVRLQKKYNCIFSIVDYHAITVPYDPKMLSKNIVETAIVLLAIGIDVKKSILFVQSAISEHTELAWLLNTITPIGELKRMTQFKQKAKKYPKAINAGLFNYPILMAADILLYKAKYVPVGEDQLQHLELAREIARKFNKLFGTTFPEPEPILTKGKRIMSLTDPSKKMSKTSANPKSYITLFDSPNLIWGKLSTAVTDPARKRKIDPGDPKKCNLFTLHQFFSSKEEIDYIINGCKKAKIGCLDCKRILAKNISKQLLPIQEKIKKYSKNKKLVEKILSDGTKKAKRIARKNLDEIKKKMGFTFK